MLHTPRTVSDVMTHTVIAVGREAPFKEIVALMEQWKISALPVLAGEGRVIGVVSEADLLPKEAFRDSDPTRLDQLKRLADLAKAGGVSAGEVMSTPAVTVHPDTTLPQAARVMAQRHVKRLPVTDVHGLLQGVVSRGDLLKVFLRSDGELAEEVNRTVVALLFPAGTVTVRVEEGVVTLGGTIRDRSLVPVAARLTRAVEGVVDVRVDLAGNGSRPHRGAAPTC
ncbi:Inosine-5'-monophosphate dehydrogenase [Streptomyces formicae]|uniref:Inosine-5'-monophosphate dehydrogenase n=2 Tax=Streptomyces formicae TaxID=1616117 RepID=A0A291QM24_9ACTN|nr:CBS domain-containing protein [Streptomyces formicae]ATL32566.1 Inosine-5'-monophosphate dehydrogenase [Streptomyces formicae]